MWRLRAAKKAVVRIYNDREETIGIAPLLVQINSNNPSPTGYEDSENFDITPNKK